MSTRPSRDPNVMRTFVEVHSRILACGTVTSFGPRRMGQHVYDVVDTALEHPPR